jgi:hypothetical protein
MKLKSITMQRSLNYDSSSLLHRVNFIRGASATSGQTSRFEEVAESIELI